MTNSEATKDYKKLTYKLAKAVDQLSYIYERMKFINEQMEWDGLFEVDFSEALQNLAKVQSAAILYSMSDDYIDSEIKEQYDQLKALEESKNING